MLVMKQLQILSKREENGEFKSLSDFIHRINPKDVNKLQLEGLVKAGAFDKLDTNRKKLFFSIPKIIQTIKNYHDDKISKQTNLFENLNEKNNLLILITIQKIFGIKGCYLKSFVFRFLYSDHPLKL